MRVSQGRSYQGQKSLCLCFLGTRVCAMQEEEEKGGKKTKWGVL